MNEEVSNRPLKGILTSSVPELCLLPSGLRRGAAGWASQKSFYRDRNGIAKTKFFMIGGTAWEHSRRSPHLDTSGAPIPPFSENAFKKHLKNC